MLYLNNCWPYLYYGLCASVKVNKPSLNNSSICETPPFPVSLLIQYILWCIPFPLPKCHKVKTVKSSLSLAIYFSLHPSLANWSQLWSEYGPESLVWVIIITNDTIYLDLDRQSWLLCVIVAIWINCKACINLDTFQQPWMMDWVIFGHGWT